MSSEFWTRQILPGSFSAVSDGFFNWYRREFFNLFSPDLLEWLTDQGDRQLILRAGERDLWCTDKRGGRSWRLSADEISSSSLDEALARHSLTPAAVRIGIEIDAGSFFVRRFDIPSIALTSLPKLLASDIERKTPFTLDDIIYGHTFARHESAAEKTQISLWILRKDIAAEAAKLGGIKFKEISFIRPVGGNPSETKPIIELGDRKKSSKILGRITLALCMLTLLFAIVGIGATLWRQAALNEELDSKIHDMSTRAARLRQIIDKASAESRLLTVLRSARREPLFADVWEEIARILPDSAFLTELRVTENKPNERIVDIIGFANSAVGLPAQFNKSLLFNEATLTAPITPDPHEKRESFSLQAKIERRLPESNQ